MTRLFYIANMRFPTERAHGIQVAKMCEAFARNGARVTLLVPDRKTLSTDPFSYYGLERNFTVEKVQVPDVVSFGAIGFFIESFLFARRAIRHANKEQGSIVYTREEWPLFFLPDQVAFYEAHQLRKSRFFRGLIKQAKGIVSISQGLKDALVLAGYLEGKILVAHDGYDEKQFVERISKSEARTRLVLPQDRKIVMYVGGLEAWKGVETLCQAALFLKADGIQVVVIGGTGEEKKRFEKRYPLITFLGARPYVELPQNLQAADILVLPNSATSELGSKFTSPLKLFAYMASGVPMVMANVPVLKEVVGSTQAILFMPDDPHSLANAIGKALDDPEAAQRTQAAKDMVKDFTWDKRAKNVLAYITQLCGTESL
ncbi:MAG: glycosyltransferase [Patescibacteria group bacterium]